MSEKRKDSKGRVLHSGEYQDKDGRYVYKHFDAKGVRRAVYSWKLVDSDKVPAGKRCMGSLRDMEKPKRHALTEPQQAAFVSFIAESKTYKHWLPLFTVLLGTGCRVGEEIGLRWSDCDFESGIIHIDHNLIYRQGEGGGNCCFRITTPKTAAGTRIVPMLSEVKQALLNERTYQTRHDFNKTVIDGYSGFIFQNRYGDCLSPHCINRAIERISRDYNADETKLAQAEDREPLLLPHFSVHNLRHTFCTRFCERGNKRVSGVESRNLRPIYDQKEGTRSENDTPAVKRLPGRFCVDFTNRKRDFMQNCWFC